MRFSFSVLCFKKVFVRCLSSCYFVQAIQQLQPKTVPLALFLVGAALDIFQTLIGDLDTEGRYLFLNAVANQLRYPNTHTHYFSFILLYLFAESNQVQNVLLSMLVHFNVYILIDVEVGSLYVQLGWEAIGTPFFFSFYCNWVSDSIVTPVIRAVT